MAEENSWYMAQDSAWEGYTEFPLWIIQGHMTMLLCFNTEGATDPVNYRQILWHGKYSSMENG